MDAPRHVTLQKPSVLGIDTFQLKGGGLPNYFWQDVYFILFSTELLENLRSLGRSHG